MHCPQLACTSGPDQEQCCTLASALAGHTEPKFMQMSASSQAWRRCSLSILLSLAGCTGCAGAVSGRTQRTAWLMLHRLMHTRRSAPALTRLSAASAGETALFVLYLCIRLALCGCWACQAGCCAPPGFACLSGTSTGPPPYCGPWPSVRPVQDGQLSTGRQSFMWAICSRGLAQLAHQSRAAARVVQMLQ